MTTHSRLSPSKRYRWSRCPGSIREEANLQDATNRSGPAAIDGTHSHTLLELCIDQGLIDPMVTVGESLSDHEGEFVVDADRAARVKIAIDYVKLRLSEINQTMGYYEVLSETRVDPERLLGRDDLGGTVDIQINGSGILEIIDYKDGRDPVSAIENLQLEQYAIGKLAEYAYDDADDYQWREVRLTIVQPKMVYENVNPITTWTVSVAYLLSRAKVLLAEAIATDDPAAPLNPGKIQCKFCPVRSCSARANHVMKEVDVMFESNSDVATQVADVATQVAEKNPSMMDNHQIRKVVEVAPMMRQFLEAVEEEARSRLTAGDSIPGLKLVSGRGTRAWSLSEDEVVDKLKKMGIPKSSAYVTQLVSPAQAEKLTWEKQDGTKVSLSKQQISRMNQEYVTKLSGKLTVALESDKRQAVVTSVAPLFPSICSDPPVESPTVESPTVESPTVESPTVESLPSWLSSRPEKQNV